MPKIGWGVGRAWDLSALRFQSEILGRFNLKSEVYRSVKLERLGLLPERGFTEHLRDTFLLSIAEYNFHRAPLENLVAFSRFQVADFPRRGCQVCDNR